MTLSTLACPGQDCGHSLFHHSPKLHGVLLNHLLPTCTQQNATHTPRLMPTRLREAQHAEAGPISPLQLGKLADAIVQLIQHLSAAPGNQAHDNDATHTYRDVICREAGDDKLVKGLILARALNALHELTKLSRHDKQEQKEKPVGCSLNLHSSRYSLRATRVHEASCPTCKDTPINTQRSLQLSTATHMCHQDSQHRMPSPITHRTASTKVPSPATQDSQHGSAQSNNSHNWSLDSQHQAPSPSLLHTEAHRTASTKCPVQLPGQPAPMCPVQHYCTQWPTRQSAPSAQSSYQ